MGCAGDSSGPFSSLLVRVLLLCLLVVSVVVVPYVIQEILCIRFFRRYRKESRALLQVSQT